MSLTNSYWPDGPLILNFESPLPVMSRDDFFTFCQQNPDLRIERTADGEIVIMTPAGLESSRRNSDLSMQLAIWSKQDGTGIAFDSSGGFWITERAMRSPDAAWMRRERWEAISSNERKKFAPLVPDFVVELRSETDRLSQLRAKMQEYIDNGVRLAWLIDPIKRRVEIYRPGQAATIIEGPSQITGDPELPGFTLDLTSIW